MLDLVKSNVGRAIRPYYSDEEHFRSAVVAAAPTAKDDQLVTFGIYPDRPETGYGWLELEAKPSADLALVIAAFPSLKSQFKDGKEAL